MHSKGENFMRRLILLIAVLAVPGLVTPVANACSCIGPRTPCEAFGTAAAVFVGTAIRSGKAEPLKDKSEPYGAPVVVKFTVEQSYLGVDGTEIEVFTGSGGGDCGYEFKIGERYLVYAYRDHTRLITGICTRTKPFARATEDLAFLGNLSSASAGATIQGQLTRPAAAKNDSSPIYSEMVVVVESDKVREELRPDTSGKYRISGLPPGKFKVTLKLPKELTVYQAEQEISVADRGCGSVNYYITENGQVSGRVFDSEGQPIPKIWLSLIDPDSDPKTDAINSARTDEEGRFSFSPVRAGRYLIAVNNRKYPDPNDPGIAYPPAFYPGVTDKPQAEVITVKVGEKLTDLDIRMPPRRPGGVINGLIVKADGSPVHSAALIVMDITEGVPKIVLGIQVDEQGRFTINGYIGQVFAVQGGISGPKYPNGAPPIPVVSSGPQRIAIERATQTIKLVVPTSPNE
jgi:Carboxypeptidase regulatory-like domain